VIADTSLVKKLYIGPGEKVAIVNSPAGFIRSLRDLPSGVILTETLSASVDFAMLFAQTSKDVERLVPEALRALKRDGMFWVCYPNGTSGVRTDLNRDILWRLMSKFKLAGVPWYPWTTCGRRCVSSPRTWWASKSPQSQERTITSIILKRFRAFRECGSPAGMVMVSPMHRRKGFPEMVTSASPSSR